MASDDDFEPNDLQYQISQNKDKVRLIFSRDSGERRVVTLPRNHLASLVAGAQNLLSPTDAVPIDRGSLRAGTTIRVTGYQFSPRDTELGLTIFADLPEQGRGVTIPLHFTRKDVESIVGQMQRWLESHKA